MSISVDLGKNRMFVGAGKAGAIASSRKSSENIQNNFSASCRLLCSYISCMLYYLQNNSSLKNHFLSSQLTLTGGQVKFAPLLLRSLMIL